MLFTHTWRVLLSVGGALLLLCKLTLGPDASGQDEQRPDNQQDKCQGTASLVCPAEHLRMTTQ